MTSGAIQKGVPTKVLRLLVVLVSWPATPKSANLTSPCSLSNTLAAVYENKTVNFLLLLVNGQGRPSPLMSRWSLRSECRYSKPLSTSRRMMAICISSKLPAFIRSSAEPPPRYSIMIHSFVSYGKKQKHLELKTLLTGRRNRL